MASSDLQYLCKVIERGRSRFVYGLDRVPQDKLEWPPGGSAHSAIGLAGRLVTFLGFIGYMTRERAMPERRGGGEPPRSVEEAKAAINAAAAELISAVSALTQEDLEKTLPAPWGVEIPLGEWAWMIPGVIGYHQGQLNLLQLAWGDTDPNIPPEWREG